MKAKDKEAEKWRVTGQLKYHQVAISKLLKPQTNPSRLKNINNNKTLTAGFSVSKYILYWHF